MQCVLSLPYDRSLCENVFPHVGIAFDYTSGAIVLTETRTGRNDGREIEREREEEKKRESQRA